MNCTDFEILLCDYMDGTLDEARRSELEAHQRECASCAELAKDVAGAVAFVARVPHVEPPPELLALAIEHGCKFSIDSDAHATGQLEWLPHGCQVAADGEVPVERIVNTWSVDELLAWTEAAPGVK